MTFDDFEDRADEASPPRPCAPTLARRAPQVQDDEWPEPRPMNLGDYGCIALVLAGLCAVLGYVLAELGPLVAGWVR